MPAATPPLALSLHFALPRGSNLAAEHRAVLQRRQVRRWLQAALQGPAVLNVRVVDEAEGRELNRSYRQKDYATNVLTFEYGAPMPGEPLEADVVLCATVVAKEAAEQQKTLQAHYAHLLVHGALHAQGYDHERAKDAKVMEALEARILAGLGFPDPYSSGTSGRT